MKAIRCEMCNSNDVVKDGDFFVCQACGTKYTVEEAKKLMFEGTVKIDNTEFVQKYLANARRAKQKEDWKEAEKYYNMVEQNDPANIEAIFYSSFAQVKLALLEKDTKEKRQNVFNILIKGVSVIDDNYDNTNEEHLKLLPVIMNDIQALRTGTIVPTTHLAEYVTKNGYGNVVDRNQVVRDDPLSVTYEMINKVVVAYLDSLANIIENYSPESVKKLFMDNIYYLPASSPIHERIAPHIDGYKTPKKVSVEIAKQVKIDATTKRTDVDTQIHSLGKTICPMYMSGNILSSSLVNMVIEELRGMYPDHYALKPKKSGCYVATAVYGSYNCPEVWTLRRYRDYTLAETWHGRAFIRTYYAVSPTLVKWFGNTKWFKKMWQPKLDRMVKRLNNEGVADTPYQDRDW